MQNENSPWFDDKNCDLLRKWLEVDGKTFREIARKFEEHGVRVTRAAIIGRAHRMKLVAPNRKKELLHQAASQRAAVFNIEKARILNINKKKRPVGQIIIRNRKFNPNWKQKVDMSPEKPDGKKAVLLKDSYDGQCKAILGYVNGQCSLAVYCGETTVPTIKNGIEKMSSWCSYHHKMYLQEDKR